jgi:ABC-type uncharacterized transport system substrate-binding protein
MKRILFSHWMILLFILMLFVSCNEEGASNKKSRNLEITSYAEELNSPLPVEKRKRVMVLHSYHPEYVWVQNINRGIDRGLEEERFVDGKNISVEYFYMDTKRKTSEEWKQKKAAEAIAHISQWKPHVVIATDDNAQKYVVSKMKDTQTNFVFLGVNADPRSYGYIESLENPGGNITGSIERERFGQSVDLLRRLVPGIRKVAIICDDGPTGVPIIRRVMKQADEVGIEIVDVKQTGSFSEWKHYVLAQQNRADALLVIVYHTLKDEQGNAVHEDRVMNWTIGNSRIPDFGTWAWAVEGGLLCSEAISGYQQGHYAGTVASYVLMGQKPGEFPVDKPQRGEVCINQARAEMLGITIPADLMRTATIYKTIGSADYQARK